MGKNTNQIATFGDLKSIGYRWTTDIMGSPANNHCVTTSDIYRLKDKNYTVGNNYWTYTHLPTTYSTNSSKCIKWSDVPASTAQGVNPSGAYNQAKNIAYCRIEEGVSGKTQASTINVYYVCKVTSTSPDIDYLITTTELGSGGKVDVSSTGLLYLPLNPINNTSLYQDWLRITCGTTGSNRTWKYKLGYGSEPSSWSNFPSKAASVTLNISKSTGAKTYASTIQKLTHVCFRVE